MSGCLQNISALTHFCYQGSLLELKQDSWQMSLTSRQVIMPLQHTLIMRLR